jgi:two-component system cell cycle sensor histidine kinase/response regulator CckA
VRPINVLIVEDSENDSILLLAELKKSGYAPHYQRVETRLEMSKALQEHDWEVVISDYVMPHFSGLDALETLKQLNPGLPFIAVSGVHGEEAAVHMMKAGAADYILKGNLSRLVPAIEREMESTKSRHARLKAELNMQHLAAIVQSSDDAIYGQNLESVIVSWNPAAERIYGYTAEEMIGRPIAILFPSDRHNELLDIITSVRRGDLVEVYETERLRKDRTIIPVSLSISPIRDLQGKSVGASCIARDITKQKAADNERLKMIGELTEALRRVKILHGLLPICASCKCIRDDQGYWQKLETYLTRHTDAQFTHGICPKCAEGLYQELEKTLPA